MKKSSLFPVISGLLLCVWTSCGHRCPDPQSESYADMVWEIGRPQHEHTFAVCDSSRLHEYQGGLYRFIPHGDTLHIVESAWENGDARFIAWHIYGRQKIIDRLCIPPGVQY